MTIFIYDIDGCLMANGLRQYPEESPLEFLGRVVAKGGVTSFTTWPHVVRKLDVGPVPSFLEGYVGTLFSLPLYVRTST